MYSTVIGTNVYIKVGYGYMEDKPKKVRIQFDIDLDLWNRAKKYIKKESVKGVFGLIAFEEWVNRREGRDKKLQTERRMADLKWLQELINSGDIKISKDCIK